MIQSKWDYRLIWKTINLVWKFIRRCTKMLQLFTQSLCTQYAKTEDFFISIMLSRVTLKIQLQEFHFNHIVFNTLKIFSWIGTVYKPRRQVRGEGVAQMSTLLNESYTRGQKSTHPISKVLQWLASRTEGWAEHW